MKSNEQIDREVAAMSLVRQNLLTRRGYVPYCGRGLCMYRATFNGSQFACRCGWVSEYEPEFIERYKAAQAALRDGVPPCGEAQPELWAIFDSQGYYNAVEGEDEARKFVDRYNARADDPLKPYTMRRYVPADDVSAVDGQAFSRQAPGA